MQIFKYFGTFEKNPNIDNILRLGLVFRFLFLLKQVDKRDFYQVNILNDVTHNVIGLSLSKESMIQLIPCQIKVCTGCPKKKGDLGIGIFFTIEMWE